MARGKARATGMVNPHVVKHAKGRHTQAGATAQTQRMAGTAQSERHRPTAIHARQYKIRCAAPQHE